VALLRERWYGPDATPNCRFIRHCNTVMTEWVRLDRLKGGGPFQGKVGALMGVPTTPAEWSQLRRNAGRENLEGEEVQQPEAEENLFRGDLDAGNDLF
jgi:hypothetical protein